MSAAPPGSAPRSRVPWVVAGLVVVALAVGGAYYYWPTPTPPAPDAAPGTPLPPLTASPYRNTQPDVAYVGDDACTACHADHVKNYRQHPMGRSMFTPAAAPPLERYEPDAGNPFRAGRFRFEVVRRGADLVHREWCADDAGKVVAEKEAVVRYVVGSGTQARSYLHGDDNHLFQSPITWYTRTGSWNLAPGYEKGLLHFHRRIDSRCLYCHCHEAHPVADSTNRYRDPPFGQLAIGCERCHGPGARHVETRAKGQVPDGPDLTIVNPRHLSPALRENVCEQCHLQGETIVVRRGRNQADYRPGLPLHEYVAVFVRPPSATDAHKIVTHFEQMHLSTCFTKSQGAFGCISCHDPHRHVTGGEEVEFYKARCLACHGPTGPAAPTRSRVPAPGCSLPVPERTAKAPGDNCLTCHMPRSESSNANHMAVTDHRVPRHADRPPQPKPVAGETPILNFHREHLRPDDPEAERDLGIGLIDLASMADGFGMPEVRDYLGRKALPLLDRAAAHAPDDVAALDSRGFALYTLGRPDEALAAYDDALARNPNREATLARAARIADTLGRLEAAERYGRSLTGRYPAYADHHFRLATTLVKRRNWPEALAAARKSLQLDPFNTEARALLITVLLETRDHDAARAEFDALGALDPAYRDRLKPWFAEQLRRTRPPGG